VTDDAPANRVPSEPPTPAGRGPDLVPGRGRPVMDSALRHLKASPVLKACLVVAFMSYGGLVFLLVAGRFRDRAGTAGSGFFLASVVGILSLLSWTFLFLWFPALDRMRRAASDEGRPAWLPDVLEDLGTVCVALVQILMAIIVVYLATH
jgi:hypothetical protein